MSLLRTLPATTPVMMDVWGDRTLLLAMLAFERELARAQAAEGIIAPEAASAIAAACDEFLVDAAALAREAAHAGTLAIPLVARLRSMLSADAAAALHRWTTSQDVMDTALMMQVCSASRLVLDAAARIGEALETLARSHAALPAIGRTLLQDARPIGFGLRVAQWLAGIRSAAARLDDAVSEAACVQLGGAVGTRAGQHGRGEAVARRLAEALDLRYAEPWHTRRDGVAAVGAALGILLGMLGKTARDVALLSQDAIGEAREPAIEGRGGSSAMPHKRNPTGCQVALSAAIRAPGLVAGLLGALPNEEERGLGGWQAEAPIIADLFLLAAGAADAMATVAEGLEIDEAAIARNLADAGQGDEIGESEAIVAALLGGER